MNWQNTREATKRFCAILVRDNLTPESYKKLLAQANKLGISEKQLLDEFDKSGFTCKNDMVYHFFDLLKFKIQRAKDKGTFYEKKLEEPTAMELSSFAHLKKTNPTTDWAQIHKDARKGN
jgi:hypothetical protein